MSFVQADYHIVFSTKDRRKILRGERVRDLYGYLWGILKQRKCHLYRMGGTDDHIHMLIHLHQDIALANLLRDMKTSSTSWIRREHVFADFPGWQHEYGAFTKSHSHLERVETYIRNQEEHHQGESFGDELRRLLREAGIDFDERHLL